MSAVAEILEKLKTLTLLEAAELVKGIELKISQIVGLIEGYNL